MHYQLVFKGENKSACENVKWKEINLKKTPIDQSLKYRLPHSEKLEENKQKEN